MSTPTAKTARLLSLVPFLLTHQNIALSQLSHEFSLTDKEMIDDLNTLWMCGLPGYTPLELIDLSFDSGFVTISNAEVLKEVRSLTKEELIVLLLGLDLVKSAAAIDQTDVIEAIDSLRLKAQGIVGDIVIAQPAIDHETLSLVNLALKQRNELSFSYLTSSKDGLSSRVIRPTDLRSEGSVHYLDGFCMDAGAFRTFRIDRISHLVLGESYADSTNTEVEVVRAPVEKVHGALRIHSNPRKSSERLGISLESTSGAIEATIEYPFFSEEWIVRTSLSSAGDIELIEPVGSRSEVLARSASLLKAYERGELPA